MTSGLTTTFDVLARTDNQAAVELLVQALGHVEPVIARGALSALLSRPGPPGQREILRLFAHMDEASRALIRQHPGCLADAMRDAVLGHDRELCETARAAILELREYDLIAALRTALEDTLNPNATIAAATALALCQLLHDEIEARPDFRPHRDPRQIRLALLNCLEATVQRYATHKRPEPLEAFLLLARRDNPVLLEILHEPRHPSYVALINRLTHSDRPAVMDLVLGFLTKAHAPSAALTVIAHRGDLPFINRLLRLIASEPAAAAAHNLSRIESFVWLRREATQLDELDDTLQEAAVKLVMATGIKRLAAFEVVAHFIERGKPGGRRAAAAALAGFHGAVANQLALRAITDVDPMVQAAAVPQLRERGIPGALAMLIEYLASPHPPVRDAARESLAEFSLDRYFAAFEMLSLAGDPGGDRALLVVCKPLAVPIRPPIALQQPAAIIQIIVPCPSPGRRRSAGTRAARPSARLA